LDSRDAGLSFHAAVRFMRRICLWMIGVAALILVVNWVFLSFTGHSGADNYSANALVVNAQMAFWPLVVLFLLLFGLEFLGAMAGSKQIIGTFLAIVIFLTVVESFVGDSIRRQFFPGTDYFWNHVWPMVWATILLAIDLLTAYVLVRDWRNAYTWRDKTGTVLVALSVIPALVAFAGLVLPNMEDMAANALWALVLFLLGIGLITTRENKEPAPRGLKLRGEGH
jgi:hypothetical protein